MNKLHTLSLSNVFSYFVISKDNEIKWIGQAQSADYAMEDMIEEIFSDSRDEYGMHSSRIINHVDSVLGRLTDYKVYQCNINENQFDEFIRNGSNNITNLRCFLTECICDDE